MKPEEQIVTFASEPGAIEMALRSGDLSISDMTLDAFMDQSQLEAHTPTVDKPGRTEKITKSAVDEVRVENLAIALANAGANGTELPETVRPYFERIVKEMIDSEEFDKDQVEKLEIFLNQIENATTEKAKAQRELEAQVKPEPTDEELIDRAMELGFSDLEGVNVTSLRSEVEDDRTELMYIHGMSFSEVDNVASGQIKTGLFGRFKGLLWGKQAKKNATMERLAQNTRLLEQFEQLKEEAAYADMPATRGKRDSIAEAAKVRASMERRQEDMRRSGRLGA